MGQVITQDTQISLFAVSSTALKTSRWNRKKICLCLPLFVLVLFKKKQCDTWWQMTGFIWTKRHCRFLPNPYVYLPRHWVKWVSLALLVVNTVSNASRVITWQRNSCNNSSHYTFLPHIDVTTGTLVSNV